MSQSAKANEEDSVVAQSQDDSDGVSLNFTLDERPGMKWYIVQVYTNYENQAKLALEERIKSSKMLDSFGKIIVPEESVVEMVKGKKKTTRKKFFPGYMLVQMMMNDDTWHLVQKTPKVNSFVGDKRKPMPLSIGDIEKMKDRVKKGIEKPRHKISFVEGDKVRVIDGPFANFSGSIEEVRPDKGKIKVAVSIFGRTTPVELDFAQVEKD